MLMRQSCQLIFSHLHSTYYKASRLLQVRTRRAIAAWALSVTTMIVAKAINWQCSIYKGSKQQSGFTLVELIVTTCILVIIALIAAPSILNHLTNMEAKRIRYDVSSSLAMAKAESYIRKKEVIVCLSDTAGRCNKNSTGSLLLFIDQNDNNHFDRSQDLLIHKQNLDPRYASLHLRAGSRHHTKFFGDTGKPRGHFGHIKYCPNVHYNGNQYQISFNKNGIVKYKPSDLHDTGCNE